MFGETYQFVQPPLKAETGEYLVTLTKIEERNLKGYNVLTFSFKYDDGKVRVPNTFDLFDVYDKSDERQLRQFNLKMSKIALCFGLKGGFNPTSYNSWVGHTGRIFITRSENGFLNVSDFLPKDSKEEYEVF